MSDVKFWQYSSDHGGYIEDAEYGYVSYEDYAALRQQLAEAQPSKERNYDQRVWAILAFNTCTGDLDDKLQAAWEKMLEHAALAQEPRHD